MSYRWSEDTTMKFVSQYLHHECLWNIKSPLYKNKQIKQSAYLDLENTMNISGFGEKEIKLKIKNIRSTYSQELKKIKESKKSGAGIDTVYVPSVKWFSLMDGSLRNITAILTESESNLPCEESSQTDIVLDTDVEKNRTAADNFQEPELKSKTTSKKRKLSQLSNMVNQLKEISDTTNSTTEDNEFEIFGKHVGVQLKSMPILLALEAQEHIQLYINKIRRQQLQNTYEQNGFTRTTRIATPLSSYDSQDSQSCNSSTYNDNGYFHEHHSEHDTGNHCSSFTIPSDNLYNETQTIIVTAMNNANVDT